MQLTLLMEYHLKHNTLIIPRNTNQSNDQRECGLKAYIVKGFEYW